MNASQPPGEQTPPDPQFGRSERPAEGFFGWIRGLGFSRAQDRWFAGVASGIAAKIGIDPLIVRGVFLVLAVLGGPGILLYVLGWLLMPDHTGRIHLEDIVRGRASTGVLITAVVLAAVIVLPVLLRIAGLPFGGLALWDVWGMPDWISALFAVLWWTALVGGAIWVIVWFFTSGPGAPGRQARTADARGDAGAEAGGDATGPKTAPTTPPPPGDAAEPSRDWAQWSEQVGQRAGEWGEDVGRRAAEWGERVSAESAARHRARRLGAGHILLTLAFALLAGGTAVAAILTGWVALPLSGDASQTWLAYVVGGVIALAVIGLSLIVAGARGKDGGILVFFSWCGVVALLFTAVFPSGSAFQPFGQRTVTISSDGDARGVTMIAGNATVDLSDLDDGTGRVNTEVWLLAGQARVVLPEDRPTIVDVRLLAGDITERGTDSDGRQSSGVLLHRTITAGSPVTGSRASASDDTAHVTIRLAFGSARVSDDPADFATADAAPMTALASEEALR